MARYVLLNQNNAVVNGPIEWDGVTPYTLPEGITAHPLPDPAPAFKKGDIYNPANDTVTPVDNRTPAQINFETIYAQAVVHMTNLQEIIDTQDIAGGTLTTAQLSTIVRQAQQQIKTLARGQRKLVRLALQLLDGTD